MELLPQCCRWAKSIIDRERASKTIYKGKQEENTEKKRKNIHCGRNTDLAHVRLTLEALRSIWVGRGNSLGRWRSSISGWGQEVGNANYYYQYDFFGVIG